MICDNKSNMQWPFDLSQWDDGRAANNVATEKAERVQTGYERVRQTRLSLGIQEALLTVIILRFLPQR